MKKITVEVGKRFARLVFVRMSSVRSSHAVFVCDCGVIKEVCINDVRRGAIKSCGCLRNERVRMARGTNGVSYSKDPQVKRTYRIWSAMKNRCYNKQNQDYQYYGGKGVEVRWISYEQFVLDMGLAPNGLTIDRIDTSGNYEKSNCRWATRE